MTGVPAFRLFEQLIDPVIPTGLPRQAPPRLPSIELPTVLAPIDDDVLLAGWLDRSGRVPAAIYLHSETLVNSPVVKSGIPQNSPMFVE
jgi:hypothetical protein